MKAKATKSASSSKPVKATAKIYPTYIPPVAVKPPTTTADERKPDTKKPEARKPDARNQDSKKAETEHTARVIESGSCPSLSGRSQIGYDVGTNAESTLLIRIRSNSGTGGFNAAWFPLTAILQALEKAEPPITSATLRSVTRKCSANNAGFLLAVFKHRGLITPLPDKQRGYALSPDFHVGMKQLREGSKATPTKAKPRKK